ncbi:LamG-like jellyroll fold domain-containing protein [Arthrobacter sp. NPDC090010]|uniref:LamG-like jellyroll fold domain-containing protein n=1 Tax=Arthrobacter sp. NPDC090010 TaxID=3363942 RepID=UPI00381E7017
MSIFNAGVRRRLLSSSLATALLAVLLATGAQTASAESVPDPTQPPALGEIVGVEPGTADENSLTPEESDALAEAKSSGVPVVVDSLTTEKAQTKAMPDGTFAAELSTDPVRVKSGSGWETIDASLQTGSKNGEEGLIPKSVIADVALGKGGSDSMAYVGDHQGAAITQKWPFGALPAPTVEGDTATYAEVIPGVDLLQLVKTSGVSQVLRIKTKEALTDPRVAQMRFFLHADGATVKDRGDGKGLVAVTSDGRAALETADGQWWDSSWAGATAAGPGGPGLTYPLALSIATENGQQVQKLGMDAVLAAKNLTFPVFVDPDWTATDPGYTYVDSNWPSMSYWKGSGGSDDSVHVGFLPAEWDYVYGVSHVTRGFYQFDTGFLAGKKILKAVMNTTEVWSPSCTPAGVAAYATTTVGSGTTWGAQPTWGTKFSTVNVAKGNSASCPAGAVGFDMGTAMSALSTDAVWTVGLRAVNESDGYGWKRFAKDARLIVTYDTRPNTPALWWIEDALYSPAKGQPGAIYYTRLSTPTFGIMSMGDPDGAEGGNLTMNVAIKNSAGTVMDSGKTGPGSPKANTMFTWKGSKVLPDGRYSVNSSVTDAQGFTSGTQSFAFTVDTTPPPSPLVVAPPSVVSTGSNQGVTTATPGKDSLAFTIKDGGSYGVDSFIYAVTKIGETVTYPGNMACGTRKGPFVSICAASNAATVPVGAIDRETVIRAWAVDEAGNVNLDKASTLPTSYTLTTSGRAVVPENLLNVMGSGGATWTDVAVTTPTSVPVANNCVGTATEAGPDQRLARAFDLGTPGARGLTTGAAVDASQAFSVAAWVCPKALTGVQSIITQLAGSAAPAARLAVLTSGGVPQYALQGWASVGSAPDAVVNSNSGVTAGTWSYVAGAYDPVNRQMRIMVTSSGFTTTWITATSSPAHLASNAAQPVVLGDSGVVGTDQFTGQIFRPVLAQGVLTTDQLGFLSDSFDLHGEEGLLK